MPECLFSALLAASLFSALLAAKGHHSSRQRQTTPLVCGSIMNSSPQQCEGSWAFPE